jgi:hypothetical protein
LPHQIYRISNLASPSSPISIIIYEGLLFA